MRISPNYLLRRTYLKPRELAPLRKRLHGEKNETLGSEDTGIIEESVDKFTLILSSDHDCGTNRNYTEVLHYLPFVNKRSAGVFWASDAFICVRL